MSIPFRNRLTCSVKDALEATGLGKTKLYELISDGTVGTVKIGGKRLVIIESLKQLADGEPNAEPR